MNRKNNITHRMKKSGLLCLVLITALYGCGEDPVAPATNNDKPDMQDMDVNQPDGGGDMPVDQPEDMCVAQTMCPAGSCGMVGDGCGGQLDCGACQCENGQPIKIECGQCGLGSLNCGGATPVCEEAGWPAFGKVECKNIVYVRAGAPANAPGSKEAPLGDINEALRKAQGLGKGSIVLIGGNETFNLTSSLELADEIHLVGGIDPVTWTRSPNRPELIFTLSGADAVALRARTVRNPTLISGLRVRVSSNPTPGGNVYGLIAEASNGLVLERLAFEVGSGGKGVDGERGENGDNGGSGEDGKAASFYNGNGSRGSVSGGKGGTNPSCEPAGCIKSPFENFCQLGGKGGDGGGWTSSMVMGTSTSGANSVDGILGGEAGRPITGARAGRPGADGSPQATPPSPGQPGLASGFVEAGVFKHVGVGGDGISGRRGESGGGGGGAVPCDNSVNVPVAERCTSKTTGTSGGGGGAGGCGGGGATGGRPGGSSFGLLVVASQGLVVRDSTFQAGPGGEGGAGEEGGLGGQGGVGGQGTNAVIEIGSPPATMPYRSGDGGKGAIGQPGSASGGGAGGFSFGAWCEENTTLIVEGQVNLLGAGGGVGGRGKGSSDLNGSNGLTGQQQGCLP